MMNASAISPSRAIGRALLISNDAVTIRLVGESMQQLALHAQVCADIPTALGLLNQRKFEAAIVDVGGDAKTVVEKIRLSPANRTIVIFAISDNDAEASEVLRVGASFVIRKPFSAVTIENTLRTAYGSIVQERRRYFRCPVQIPASIRESGMPKTSGTVVNISASGLGIVASELLKVGVKVRVQFTLPDGPSLFSVEATTCWCKEHYTGLQFVSLSPELQSDLLDWLSRKLEENLPEEVANKFRSPGNVQL